MLSGITSVTDPRYEERKEQLKAKFDQLYEIGVRRFCILNDDFGSGSNEVVVQLVNDLNREYIKPKGCGKYYLLSSGIQQQLGETGGTRSNERV